MKFKNLFQYQRVRYAATAFVVVLVVLLTFVIRDAAANRTYTTYIVEKELEKTDSVSRFEYADGNVLRYSQDGASLMNGDLETLWTVSFSMEDPHADVMRGQILLYDRLGTSIYIFDSKHEISRFSSDRPILRACVSGKDTVAALLRDGEKTALVYYTKDGGQIAAGESSITNPGYPVSLSLSEDGTLLAVAYLTAAEGVAGTKVRFYNFGSDGKVKDNNMTAEFSWPGVFAPEVRYLKGNECAVFRDDGFTIIKGAAKPEESRSVTFREDICSVFHDGKHLGFITASGDKDHRYLMSIYSTNGNLVSSAYVDIAYERVRVCDKEVILSNHSEFTVISTGGKCRFRGRLKEGSISDALKVARDRLLILTDQKMEVIRLL